jgi:hypothetical protein
MANRLFEHFPEDSKCPICGKSDDRPCFLLPIDGTGDGNIVEAAPTHADCITERNIRRLIGGAFMEPKKESKKEVLEVKHWYHQCPHCGKTIKVILKER